ncbi:MAG: phosphoesterase, partial [Pseudomonadota bacterium]
MAMLRGLEARNEQDPQKLLRDTRTLGRRFADFFTNPRSVSIVLASLGFATFIFPAFADLILIGGFVAFAFAYTRKVTLPFRMPKRAKQLDYNDIKPGGSHKPNMSRGITHFGNDINTNEELWFN